jgi:hypothetical protein
MTQYSFNAIQLALNRLAEMHLNDANFVSVEFTDQEEFKIRYLKKSQQPNFIPTEISMITEDGAEKKLKVYSEEGPKIIPFTGDMIKDKPLTPVELNAGEMGGDQCGNVNENSYGTISFYAGGLDIAESLPCHYHCVSNSVLVSCNHVIARSDAARVGEAVWAGISTNIVASLSCILPLSCEADLATARFTVSGIQLFTVRQIGRLNNVRNPRLGEPIKKYGAKTGYTTGQVVGQTVLQVNGHFFHNVFSTSPGFSCKGDSGSSVVAGNNDLLGILSWGDEIPCQNNPRGYFWIFDNLSLTDQACSLKISILNS